MYNEEPVTMNINLGSILVCDEQFNEALNSEFEPNKNSSLYTLDSKCWFYMDECTNCTFNEVIKGYSFDDLRQSDYSITQDLNFCEINPNKTHYIDEIKSMTLLGLLMLNKNCIKIHLNCDTLYIDTRMESYTGFDFSQINVKLLLLNVKNIVPFNKYDRYNNEVEFEPQMENIESEIACNASYSLGKLLLNTNRK